jgi:hypothetical protein
LMDLNYIFYTNGPILIFIEEFIILFIFRNYLFLKLFPFIYDEIH